MSSKDIQHTDTVDFPRELQRFGKLLRLKKESKEPLNSPKGPFYKWTDPTIQNWISGGNNIGFSLDSTDLIVLDSDSDRFESYVRNHLPETLTIQSGSGGYHFYYQISGYDTNHVINESGKELGSIRAGNWYYCVVPPSTHPNGLKYRISEKRLIKSISLNQIEDLLEHFEKPVENEPTQGGGPARRPGVGSYEILDYPNRRFNKAEIFRILDRKNVLYLLKKDIPKSEKTDRSNRDFILAKALAEEGIDPEVIHYWLAKTPKSSKYNQRGSRYRNSTVEKAIEAALKDEYVNFDMTREYETKATVVTYQADNADSVEDGDRCIRFEVTHMTGEDDDGEPLDVEFVSMSKGTFRDNGDFGVQPQFSNNSKQLGLADIEDLEIIQKGLGELIEELES